MKIESSDKEIHALLEGCYFQIPRFQRPYSWETEQVNQFWKDLNADTGNEYFIGSMVAYKINKHEYGVVDGQQRLTTITVLLCTIRDLYMKCGDGDRAAGLHELIERKNLSNKKTYVLKTQTSYPYFADVIQRHGVSKVDHEIKQEEELLKNSHTIFVNRLEELVSAAKKKSKKIDLLDKIRDKALALKLIFVVLDNEDDAYVIFETLNTRGKDLSLSDLVKNHIYRHLKDTDDVDEAKLKWDTISDVIFKSSSDLSLDTFIYHFWASRYELVPIKNLFPAIRKKITKGKASQFLNDLLEDVKYYRSIQEPSYNWNKSHKKITEPLGALSLFRISQPLPTILSLVRAFHNKKIKQGKLTSILGDIEKFHFIFTAVTSSRSTGGTLAMYSSYARRIHEARDPNSIGIIVNEFIRKLKEKTPSFDDFSRDFVQIRYTTNNSKQKPLVKYILTKFAKHDGCSFKSDADEQTIEHIYPESKTNKEWTDDIIGLLGNLMLLDSECNEHIGSKDFKAKKAYLVKNNYTLPEKMDQFNDWNINIVRQATERMSDIAYNDIWSL